MNFILDKDLEQVIGGSKIPYLIQKGDTLSEIAKDFKVSVDDLCKWNNIVDPNKIEVGQKIIIKY